MYIFDNYYSLSELAKLTYATILTKLFYRNATIIRRPIYVRGKPRLSFGKGFSTGYSCRLEMFGNKNDRSKKLIFGKNCHIGDNVHFAAAQKITVGDNCLFASKIFVSDLDHGTYGSGQSTSLPWSDPNGRPLISEPVSIGDNVWIGENVCVLKGVTIGDGCIIGANSVVTKNIPKFCIAVGSPARVVKTFNEYSQAWEAVARPTTSRLQGAL